MFQLPSLGVSFFGGGRTKAQRSVIDLDSVPIHDIETSTEKNARVLKHLLRANHVNHCILFHHLQFHNHAPHILGSAYILGANNQQLNRIYESESDTLEPWEDSPGEIAVHDWRTHLGDKKYTRAYIDFFEDELVRLQYDWKALVHHYLFDGEQPLFNGIMAGLGHPLIHLAYGFEISNKEVAIEGLGLTTCCYNYLHKYMDDPKYTRPSSRPTTSLLELLDRLREDKRYVDKNYMTDSQEDGMKTLDAENEDLIVEYWNAWEIKDANAQFRDCQQAAAALLCGTGKPYDFFLVHVLTTSHAVRILLPLIPANFQVSLIRQWWMFALTTYLTVGRPAIRLIDIEGYDLNGRNTKWAVDKAINGTHSEDAHYVKAIRALKVGSETWKGQEEFYLKAAVKFADEFKQWGFPN